MSKEPDLFDDDGYGEEAKSRRDAGMDAVDETAGDWKDEARDMFRAVVPPGWVGLFENARRMLLDAGLEHPHHPNCWGSLSMWCVKQGFLEPVDATMPVANTTDPKSHHCYTKVYRRTTLR